MNIFNIGKANERISALEAELKAARDEAKAAQDSLTENSKQIEQAADALKKECDEIKGKHDAEVSAHAATKQALEKANSDLATAKKEVSELPAKIEVEASKKALQITAGQGVPAIPNTPAANPAAPQSADLSKLHGREKVIAAFKAQSAAKANPQSK